MPPEGLLKERESSLKLNKNKCKFRKKSIVFVGHTTYSEDVGVDPSKTDAITKLPVPQSLTELQRFLGMVNYLGKFIPNRAGITALLQALLKKSVVFNFQKPQLDATEKLNTLITLTHIPNIFDPNLPTRLRIDASSEGIEALLKQNHGSLENPQRHPVGHSSQVLCDSKKWYVQIEKKTLSIVFEVECFHEYLYGRKLTIIDDHQPSKVIFSRSIVKCPPRIHPKNRSMILSSSMHPVKQFSF